MSDQKQPAAKDLFLTNEAHQYLMGKDSSGKRHLFSTYQRLDRLRAVHEVLKVKGDGKAEPISLDELKMLVYEDGKVQECLQPQCAREFQPVAAVELVALEYPDVAEKFKAGTFQGAGVSEDEYGRLAPYVMGMEVGGVKRARIEGNYLPILTKDGDGEGLPFCGSLWWWNRNTGITGPCFESHIRMACAEQANRLGKRPNQVHSCSSVSWEWVIERIQEAVEKRRNEYADQREKQTKERGSLADFLEARAGNRNAKSAMRGGRRRQ